MKSLLELYGQQFRNNPMLNSDSQDYTTADVFGQMGANKRRAEYDNSLLGMVHNWATGEQRQPVQLPDNAPLMDQMKEAGMRMLNLPNDMAAGGAKTMAHWLGSAGNPEMVEPLDMLAPLGIGAMAGLAGHLRPSQLVGRAQEFPPVVRGQDGLPSQFDELANVAKEYTAVSSDVDRMRGVTNGQQMQINVANDPSRANDVGSYPIDAYDRAALDRQWRQKVARTGELFADQSRSSLPGLLTNAVDEPKGFTAYHGSPHDFDRFSMDKIGTGEGAQAYGHGLYFAENEGVAGAYKKQLTDRTNFVRPDGSLWSADGLEHMNVRATAYRGDIDGAIAKARALAADDSPVAGHAQRDLEKLLALRASGGVKPNPGRMYEVRINADPEDFLDWDKPLSQQSKPVRDAVKELRPDEQTVRMISDLEAKEASGAGNYASRMLLARLKKRFGSHAVEQDVRGSSIMSDERAAALLRDSGIPGIRYLDQGSRGAGEGSRNYVLFRDDIIEIVKKYGIAAAASMYGMSQVQDAMASEGP